MKNVQQHEFKRVWLITGASRGIGALIAEAALADGNAVVATGRNAAAIVERLGSCAALLPLALDVTNEEQIRLGVRVALEHLGVLTYSSIMRASVCWLPWKSLAMRM